MSDDVWLDAPDREGFWYFDTDDCPDGLLIIGRAVVDSPRMKSGALYVRNGRNNIPIVQYCATNPGRWLRIPPPEELAEMYSQLRTADRPTGPPRFGGRISLAQFMRLAPKLVPATVVVLQSRATMDPLYLNPAVPDQLPRGFDSATLIGSVDHMGYWTWDGQGGPTDARRELLTRLEAFHAFANDADLLCREPEEKP
jgi:hypothetical protein